MTTIKDYKQLDLFTDEAETNLETLQNAVKLKKDLRGAYLTGAYLTGAYLTGAYLTGAYLRGADLTGADLTGAYLTGADLTGADLTGADLRGAYLTGAYLRGAYLTGADLTGAYLTGADLTGADLTGAEYKSVEIKNAVILGRIYTYDVWAVLSEDDIVYIRMGCFFRKLSEWKKDFWNNDREFPNDKSVKSEQRLLAFQFAEKTAKLHFPKKKGVAQYPVPRPPSSG